MGDWPQLSCLPAVREEEVEFMGTEGRGGGNLVMSRLALGMLNLRYLGDIFVEIPSQQFEAQSSFQCRFRVCWHNK